MDAGFTMTEPLHSHHWSAILTAADIVYGWTEADFLARLNAVVKQAGLTPVSETAFTFQPQGVSAVVLLEESHVALHFWPEKGKVTVDIHICDFYQDNQPKAEKLARLLALEISNTPAEWRCLSLTG
ncbi:MAG: S-adenosylmethionine decarboxylase [Leptolyngbyaceae cyanobacterium RU_5_1]|nr:S-adenosylmethionine decarboxylase [Leptolyngbyaceae cyanobacterium RU_5_1]